MPKYIVKVNTDEGLVKTCLVETSLSHSEFCVRRDFIVNNASDLADFLIDMDLLGCVVSEVTMMDIFID